MNTNEGDSMTNLITDGWEEFELTCVSCKETFTELADPSRVARHWAGEMVQNVWSEAGDDYREFMIGIRSGHWICGAKYNDCWTTVFGSDEEE